MLGYCMCIYSGRGWLRHRYIFPDRPLTGEPFVAWALQCFKAELAYNARSEQRLLFIISAPDITSHLILDDVADQVHEKVRQKESRTR